MFRKWRKRADGFNAAVAEHNARVVQQRSQAEQEIKGRNDLMIRDEIELLERLTQNISDSIELFTDNPDRASLKSDKAVLERHLKRFKEMVHEHIS